jgi:glycyl-tRNA synthetase alpha subunit
VTERTAYILRVRKLAVAIAKASVASPDSNAESDDDHAA